MKPDPRDIVSALSAGREDVPEGLLPAIGEYLRISRTMFPGIEATQAAWQCRFEVMLKDEASSAWLSVLESSDSGDALLIAALADGEPSALRAFEETMMPEVERTLRRFSFSAEQRTEYRQQARVKILVADPPKPPRIQEFRGRGRLAGWVRTVTARLALNGQRDTRTHERADEFLEQLAVVPRSSVRNDPLRREQFRAVLRVTFQALERRDRTLLRMRYLQNMTSAALARAYKVHESTMSRWLASARAAFLASFKKHAVQALGDSEQAGELLSFVESQIDVSLQGLFASEVADVDD